MTREEKIRNIMDATAEVIRKETEAGTMTTEKFAHIMESQNSAILAIAQREVKAERKNLRLEKDITSPRRLREQKGKSYENIRHFSDHTDGMRSVRVNQSSGRLHNESGGTGSETGRV